MLKEALDIALSNDKDKKTQLSKFFIGKSFDFFCIFIEYFAIRARYKITREKNGHSFTHLIPFSSCFVLIKTQRNPKEQNFLSFVYINDALAVSLVENKGRFVVKFSKYKPEDVLNCLK